MCVKRNFTTWTRLISVKRNFITWTRLTSVAYITYTTPDLQDVGFEKYSYSLVLTLLYTSGWGNWDLSFLRHHVKYKTSSVTLVQLQSEVESSERASRKEKRTKGVREWTMRIFMSSSFLECVCLEQSPSRRSLYRILWSHIGFKDCKNFFITNPKRGVIVYHWWFYNCKNT